MKPEIARESPNSQGKMRRWSATSFGDALNLEHERLVAKKKRNTPICDRIRQSRNVACQVVEIYAAVAIAGSERATLIHARGISRATNALFTNMLINSASWPICDGIVDVNRLL